MSQSAAPVYRDSGGYTPAAWYGGDSENAELAAQYFRAVYEEHKSGIDISRDLLRRFRVLMVCGHNMTEAMKNDIAVARRLGTTATTLEGILRKK